MTPRQFRDTTYAAACADQVCGTPLLSPCIFRGSWLAATRPPGAGDGELPAVVRRRELAVGDAELH
jgi:hypothetical protein